MFVRFVPKPKTCDSDEPVSDVSATYAVDVFKWRILDIQR
jgi:hypothetical protein